MTTIDIDYFRNTDMMLHGLTGLDEIYTFYYDETNNIRKLHTGAKGFNVPELKCFVLGGVVHRGTVRDLNFPDLRTKLFLQPSVKEMKLEHVGKGTFLEVLDSPKLAVFLKWLDESGLLIHYFVLDPLYWAVIDIMDSILADRQASHLFSVSLNLKNDLYQLFRYDLDFTVDLFRRYTFPDVGRDKRQAFIAELLAVLELFDDDMAHFNYQMLKGVLQIGAKLDSLPFLENEIPNVLIDEFSGFYLKRFCLFKNSEHVADAEDHIKDKIGQVEFVANGEVVKNYRFVCSHDEVGVQISDVVIGLLGKMFTYINITGSEEISETRIRFSDRQRSNLDILNSLLDRSVEENAAFLNCVVSAEDRHRAYFLLDA